MALSPFMLEAAREFGAIITAGTAPSPATDPDKTYETEAAPRIQRMSSPVPNPTAAVNQRTPLGRFPAFGFRRAASLSDSKGDQISDTEHSISKTRLSVRQRCGIRHSPKETTSEFAATGTTEEGRRQYDISILRYFSCIEALDPVRIVAPADDTMRRIPIIVGKPVGFESTKTAAHNSRIEVLTLVSVGLFGTAAAKGVLERILGAEPEDVPDDEADERDEPGQQRGRADCSLGSFVVDATGRVEPGSFRMSIFALALGGMANGRIPDAQSMELTARLAADDFEELTSGIVVNSAVVDSILTMIIRHVGRTPELSGKQIAVGIQFPIARKTREEAADERAERIADAVPRPDPFFLADLQWAARIRADGDFGGSPLARYLSPDAVPDSEWTDCGTSAAIADSLRKAVAGKWPSGAGAGGAVPTWRQRMVAASAAALPDGAVLSVCGPPGTGKSYLIRNLAGAAIVNRGEAMASFHDPLDAFVEMGSVSLKGFVRGGPKKFPVWSVDRTVGEGIVVASSNNSAVEGVVKEMSAIASVHSMARGDRPLSYLDEIAGRALNGDKLSPDHQDYKPTWGLCSAVLGRKRNIKQFRKAMLSDFERLEDVRLTRIFPVESVREGSFQGQPRVTALGRLDGAPVYLEFLGKDMVLAAEMLRRRLPTTVTVLGCERAITSSKVDARYDVVEIDPPPNRKWLRDLIGEPDADLRAWNDARSSFLSTLEYLRNLEFDDCVPSPVPATDVEYGAFMVDVGRDVSVSVRRLTAARLYEAANPHVGRTSEKARVDVGEADMLSEKLFAAAFALRLAFVKRAGPRILDNLRIWQSRADYEQSAGVENLTEHCWRAFHCVVPICSTTLASMARMFDGMGKGCIGDLIVDEAGQAAPHSIIGGLLRARRATLVGDTRQIVPVITIPDAVSRLLAKAANLPSRSFLVSGSAESSVQSLADRASPIGAIVGGERVGMPLTLNRRNPPHILEVSNVISYDGMIVAGAPETPACTGVGGHPCRWINVTDIGGAVGNRIPAQERILLDMLIEAVRTTTDALPDGMPDWYFISPFRSVASGLRQTIRENTDRLMAAAPSLRSEAIDAWTSPNGGRVGTVHTAQGREAPLVVMCLGGNPDNVRAIAWAGATANILNVSASRAKRSLHFVGDRSLWTSAHGGVFAQLGSDMPLGATFPSLEVPIGHTVDFTDSWRPIPIESHVTDVIDVQTDDDDIQKPKKSRKSASGRHKKIAAEGVDVCV